ncbi:TPA: hypothetical protein DCX15_04570 [bacterium]|nr:hypothetical protein [bacterium]
MHLSSLIKKELVLLELKAQNKEEVIREMAELISKDKRIKDKDRLIQAMFEREELGTTGIGNGLAIPHARTDAVKDIVIAFAKSKEGADFESMDKKPANLFFMVVGPQEKNKEYLRVMSILARLFSKEENRQTLMRATTPKEIIKSVAKMEEEENLG